MHSSLKNKFRKIKIKLLFIITLNLKNKLNTYPISQIGFNLKLLPYTEQYIVINFPCSKQYIIKLSENSTQIAIFKACLSLKNSRFLNS
jgi:hypothetical protein